jgi:maltose alpha-D-glucosyltransferase/alpha-amylase
MLKLLRRLQPGAHPEVEVGRFLTEQAGFRNTPALLGVVEHVGPDGVATALGLLQAFVRNQGDAWTLMLEYLRRDLDTIVLVPESEAPSPQDAFATHLRWAGLLGQRTAEMHRALAIETDDAAFAAEPFTADDLAVLAADTRRQAEKALRACGALGFTAPESAQEAAAAILAAKAEIEGLIEGLSREAPAGAHRTRIHGDYHLGQVLASQDDLIIVDFEGEPSRPVDERRAKSTPLRDVAGILRSLAYGGETVTREVASRFAEAEDRATAAVAAWREMVSGAFLEAYAATVKGSRADVTDEATRARLLRLCLLQKALYEIDYEANNRPDWIEIPARGVLAILADQRGA